jgi:hypothetical protein
MNQIGNAMFPILRLKSNGAEVFPNLGPGWSLEAFLFPMILLAFR